MLVAGGITAASGALPEAEPLALANRVAPILVFVAAITLVTELANEAVVFLWAGSRLLHRGLGSGFIRWLFLALWPP